MVAIKIKIMEKMCLMPVISSYSFSLRSCKNTAEDLKVFNTFSILNNCCCRILCYLKIRSCWSDFLMYVQSVFFSYSDWLILIFSHTLNWCFQIRTTFWLCHFFLLKEWQKVVEIWFKERTVINFHCPQSVRVFF